MGRTLTLLAGLAALTLAACGSTAPGGAPSSPVQTPAPATTTATASPTDDPLASRTQAKIDVPGGPDWPVAAFESLWVLTPDGEPAALTRIDPATNEITATIALASGPCQAVGVTDDAVWACAGDGIVPIDPATNSVGPTVEFETARYFGYMPFGAGSLWTLGGNAVVRNQVVRIDPEAGAVAETYELDFDASWIAFGEGALWITDTPLGKLWRLDPDLGEVAEHATGLANPGPSAVAAGSIWLSVLTGPDDRPTAGDVTLVRIDAATGDVEAEIVLGGSISEIALHADADNVWVRSHDPYLAHIDPDTNEVVQTFHARELGGSVTVAYGSVWATAYSKHSVRRIQP